MVLPVTLTRVRELPWAGVAAVMGGFLLQFTMGAFYSFGNISTYMSSYMRQHSSPNITNIDIAVVQFTWGMTQGLVMPLSGFLITAIGKKAAMVSGSAIFSAGCALTYITINKKLWMVAATYGFVSAFGQNIALIPTLTTAMAWFPRNKGVVMGCVVGGFGGGSLVFTYIQTAILNPDNVSPASSGPDKGYFTDPEVLARVPTLLLILGGIYFILGMVACILITQPPDDWLDKNASEDYGKLSEDYVTPFEALKRKELYLLWITRLSVVLISNNIGAFYKAFGQTFIFDDHFLGVIGAVTSVFNCTGRLFYGMIMDKTAYKVSMSIEACLLIILISTFYLTSMIGLDPTPICVDMPSTTTLASDCIAQPVTSLTTKLVYAVWIFAIFFTFPGTYSTQPAVTTQTFGHKYGGFIYAFLFSSDIVNNLLSAFMSKAIHEKFGWLGLFLIVSAWGFVALTATLFFPYKPRPGPRPSSSSCQVGWLARMGLVEIVKQGEDKQVNKQVDNQAFHTEEVYKMEEIKKNKSDID